MSATISNTLGTDVMMQLGPLQFTISTAAYQELTRSTERKWAAIPRFGQLDALQDVGPGGDTITLRGVVYPEFRGGSGQVASMRDVMDMGEPQLMVDGLGYIHGEFVIEKVEERQSVFAAAGQPRRQEFTVTLRKYGSGFDL